MGTRLVTIISLNVCILHHVLLSISHEEPMMRSIPVEWSLFGDGPWDYNVNAQNIYNFWVQGIQRAKAYEGLYTIGMRGDGDCSSITPFPNTTFLIYSIVS